MYKLDPSSSKKSFQQYFEESSGKTKHRNVNISMPERFLERLDEAVEEEEASSRSEFVREKLKEAVIE